MEFGILLFALVAHWSSVQGFKIEEEVQKAQQDLLAQLSKRIDESYIKNPSSASWPEFKEWKDEAFGAFTPKSYELILKRVSEPSPENQTPEERTQKLFDEVLALWDSLAETSNLQKRAGGYFGWLSDVVAARWGVEATRSKIIPAANDQSVPKSQDAFGNFPVAQKQPEGPIQLALDVKPDGKIAAEITVIKPVDGTTEINPIPASSNQADGPADLFPPSQPPSRSPPRTRNLFRRAFWTKGRTDLVITFTSLAIFGTFVSLFIAMAAGAIPI